MKRTVLYGSLATAVVAAAGLWLAVHTPSDTLSRSSAVIVTESAPAKTETTTTDRSSEPLQQHEDGSKSWIVDGKTIVVTEIERLKPFMRHETRITLMEDRLIPRSWHDRVIVYGGPNNPNTLAHRLPEISSNLSPNPIGEYRFDLVYPDVTAAPSAPFDR